MMVAANKVYFPAIVSSLRVILHKFSKLRFSIPSDSGWVRGQPGGCCDQFVGEFADKIAYICHSLGSSLVVSIDVPSTTVSAIVMDCFYVVYPEDVDC